MSDHRPKRRGGQRLSWEERLGDFLHPTASLDDLDRFLARRPVWRHDPATFTLAEIYAATALGVSPEEFPDQLQPVAWQIGAAAKFRAVVYHVEECLAPQGLDVRAAYDALRRALFSLRDAGAAARRLAAPAGLAVVEAAGWRLERAAREEGYFMLYYRPAFRRVGFDGDAALARSLRCAGQVRALLGLDAERVAAELLADAAFNLTRAAPVIYAEPEVLTAYSNSPDLLDPVEQVPLAEDFMAHTTNKLNATHEDVKAILSKLSSQGGAENWSAYATRQQLAKEIGISARTLSRRIKDGSIKIQGGDRELIRINMSCLPADLRNES